MSSNEGDTIQMKSPEEKSGGSINVGDGKVYNGWRAYGVDWNKLDEKARDDIYRKHIAEVVVVRVQSEWSSFALRYVNANRYGGAPMSLHALMRAGSRAYHND